MRKIATKLTPKVKAFIKKEFKTDYYTSDEGLFHFPNFIDFKGFKLGYHSDSELIKDYTEVSEDEFINSFNKPKRGDLVLVSNDNENWHERIFLTEIKGAEYPVVVVYCESEEDFKNDIKFYISVSKYMKPIKTITKEEAEKILNKKIV